MTESEAARTLRTERADDQDQLHALLLARKLGPRPAPNSEMPSSVRRGPNVGPTPAGPSWR